MNKDLNLLRVFVAISQDLNLARTSRKLGISQPALSHSLRRLREQFGDPLLVRGPRGLIPTERALRLLPRARAALAGLDGLYTDDGEGGTAAQDFRALDRVCTIGASTFAELRITAPLLEALAREAPSVRLVTRSLQDDLPKAELEQGVLDLAITGFFQRLPEGFRVRTLFRDEQVVVGHRKHPYFAGKRTLEDYLAATHIRIAVPHGRVGRIDQALLAQRKKRRLVAELGNFLNAPGILAGSAHLLTCARSLAETYARQRPLAIAELPVKVPPVEVRMVWHERSHADPFLRWVRETIAAKSRLRSASSP